MEFQRMGRRERTVFGTLLYDIRRRGGGVCFLKAKEVVDMERQKFISACEQYLRIKSPSDYLRAVLEDLAKCKEIGAQEIPAQGFGKFFGRKQKVYQYKPRNYLNDLLSAAGLEHEHFHSGNYDARSSLFHMGYYMACINHDMHLFQCGLYQCVRIDAIVHGMLGNTGTDHCLQVYDALYGLAAADAELFAKLLPEGLGLASNGHPFSCMMTNIVMGLWYKNDALLTKGIESARKRQSLKSEPKLYKTLGRYMILADHDTENASIALEEFCRHVNRDNEGTFNKTNGKAPYMDFVCPFAHGLYNLAYYSLDKTVLSQIRFPKIRFDREYAGWLIAENFPSPDRLVDYTDEMSIMNILFDSIPVACISQPYEDDKRYYIDGADFREKLLAALSETVDLEQHFRCYNNRPLKK